MIISFRRGHLFFYNNQKYNILPMKIDKNKIEEHLSGSVFHMVGEAADSLQRECYVVGGYVRDIFLNRPSKDIDFVTVGSGLELA